jgi:tetratricopeptide (TPR) repeat protein
MAWMDYFMAPDCLLLDSLLILNLAERWGFLVEMVLASMGVGLAWNAVPASRLARYYHGRAVALAEKIQQPIAIGQAYFGLALHEHHALGNGATALEHYRRSARGYWEAGHLRYWASVRMAQSLLWIPENMPDRLALCEKVIQVSQDAGDHQALGWGLFMLAATLDQAGEMDTAVAKMLQALELLRSVPDYQVISYASGVLGRCYLRRGEIPQALTVLEEGKQIVAQHGLRGFSCVPVRLHLAQAYLQGAEQAEGLARAEAIKKAKKACRVALRQVQFDQAAKINAYRMQGTLEWLRGRPQHALHWWEQSLAAASNLGARYEGGLTCLEMGRFLGNGGYLEEAESTFKELETKFDWMQAQKLLQQNKSQPPSSPYLSLRPGISRGRGLPKPPRDADRRFP